MNSYSSNWNTPYYNLSVTAGEFQKCNLDFRRTICNKILFQTRKKMPRDESWIYSYDPETKRQSSQWKHAGSLRPKKARQSKSTHKHLMIPFFFYCTGMIYMHWVPTGQTVNKE